MHECLHNLNLHQRLTGVIWCHALVTVVQHTVHLTESTVLEDMYHRILLPVVCSFHWFEEFQKGQLNQHLSKGVGWY